MKAMTLFLAFGWAVFFVPFDGKGQCNPTNDSLELVNFFNATGGPNWTNKTNWLVAGMPISSWYGVTGTTAQGCVTDIVLNNNNLSGTLSSLSFSELSFIDLHDNGISSNLPLMNTPMLRQIWMWDNFFSGNIPDFTLPSLTTLSLSDNQLSGSIPEFSGMPNLEWLSLSGNTTITGKIPYFINCPNLTSLLLGYNSLNDTIPNFSQISLSAISLSGNNLYGSIPNFYLPNLSGLYLVNCGLSGPFPDLSSTDLVQVWLHFNDLEGCISGNFCGIDYNFFGNPKLPWQGDYSNFCNGDPQIGALCNDGNAGTTGETIQPDCSCGFCTHPDKAALIELYNSTDGKNWTTKWTDTTSCDVCNTAIYPGVTCTNGRVSSIDLHENKLVGTLPASLVFPELTALILYKNGLVGPMPDLAGCPKLENLNIAYQNQYGGGLTGAIPSYNLQELRYLFVNDNQLSGTLPANFFNGMQSLLGFGIDRNTNYAGILPTNLPPDLEYFAAAECAFTSLPAWSHSSLTEVNLFANNLLGPIPALNLPACTFLGLGENELTWSASTDFSGLPAVRRLLLNANELNGLFPASLFALSAVDTLLLFDNPLDTYLPSGFGNMTSLELLHLENCQLKGCIPSFFYNLCGTTNIRLDINPNLYNSNWANYCATRDGECCTHPDKAALIEIYNSTGGDNWTLSVPWDTTTCNVCDWEGIDCDNANFPNRVTSIDLQRRNLVGSLPLLDLPFLETLNLTGGLGSAAPDNYLTGPIPDFVLPLLKYLALGDNAFTGNPPSIDGMPELLDFRAYRNQLSGPIPAYSHPKLLQLGLSSNINLTGPLSFNLPSLEQLWLNTNSITGPFPAFNFPNLQVLALHGNPLNDFLHPSIGNLPALQELYLMDCQLKGCIPSSFKNLCSQGANANLASNPCLATTNWGNFCSSSDEGLCGNWQATISGTQTICAGDPASLTFDFPDNTAGPFSVTLNGSLVLTGVLDGVPFALPSPPTSTTTYSLTKVEYDNLGQTCDQMPISTTAGSVTITVNPIPSVSPVADQTRCAGEMTAAVLFNSSVAGSTFLWSNDEPNIGLAANGTGNILPFLVENATPSPLVGNVSVIASANGCNSPAETFSITVNPATTAAISPNAMTFCVNETLLMDENGNGDNQIWSWSGPLGWSETGQTVSRVLTSVNQQGNYSVTATNSFGCTAAATVSIFVNPNPTVSTIFASPSTTVCLGGDVNLQAIGSGGSTWTWIGPSGVIPSNGAFLQLQDLSIIGISQYAVILENASGCRDTFFIDIEVLEGPTAAPEALSPSCAGNDLAFYAVAFGNGNLTFNWSGPNGFSENDENPWLPNAQPAASGNYFLTVIDQNGCKTTASILGVVVTPPPSLSLASNSPVCPGQTLTITATVSGNTTVTWKGPNGFDSTNSSLVFSNAQPILSGNYICTAMLDGCENIDTIAVLVQNGQGGAVISTSPALACAGRAFELSGPTGAANYAWKRPDGSTATGQKITFPALAAADAGNYQLTVTAAGGCTSSGNFVLTVNISPTATASPDAATVCSGTTFPLSGGGSNVQNWAWAGPNGFLSSLQNPTVAAPFSGKYILTTTAPGGCLATDTTTLSVAPAVAASIIFEKNIACKGGSDGEIQASLTGGTAPFSFVLKKNGSQTGNSVSFSGSVLTASNLTAGDWSIEITDANGCRDIVSATLTEPSNSVSIIAGAIDSVSCNGGSDGSVSATAMGGTGAISLVWSSPTGLPTDLVAGVYSVTATDAADCSVTLGGFEVKQPDALVCTANQLSPVSSSGASDGSATVAATGGNAPFSFVLQAGGTLFGPFSSSFVLPNLAAGSYFLTLTDQKNCSTTASFSISDCAISASPTVKNVSCAGETTGSVTLNLINPPSGTVSFLWSNGATTENLINVGKGVFFVTVTLTSAGGGTCSNDFSATVLEPDSLKIEPEIKKMIACAGGSDGEIDLETSGGTGNLTFDWADLVGQNDPQNRTNLTAGTYQVTATDANGCTIATQTLALDAPPSIDFSAEQVQPKDARLTFSGGTPPFQIEWAGGNSNDPSPILIQNLTVGDYVFTLTDANGCTKTANLTISDCSVSFTEKVDSVTCFGREDGKIELFGVSNFQILWNDGLSSNPKTGLAAGQFSVVVTDSAAGCSITKTFSVFQPDSILASISSIQNVLCFDQKTGKIAASASGGTPPLEFTWSNGKKGPSLDSLAAGIFSVIVSDEKGCSATVSATVEQPDFPLLFSAVQKNAGQTPSPAELIFSGGTSPFQISWSGGAPFSNKPSPILTDSLAAGTYFFTLTDVNNCIKIDTLTISDCPILITETIKNVSCKGKSDGQIDVSIMGNTAPPVFSWSISGASGPTISNLAPGNFSVTVSNGAGGCTVSETFFVSEPSALAASISSFLDVACFGDSTGRIFTAATGGTSPFLFKWSNGAAGQNLLEAPAETYFLTVTDANDCTFLLSKSLSQPQKALKIEAKQYQVGTVPSAAKLLFSGGTEPFQKVEWNGGSQDSLASVDSFLTQPLAAGTYFFTLTDANGCRDTVTLTISDCSIQITGATADVSCFGGNDGRIEISLTGSTQPVFAWSTGDSTSTLQNLKAGIYALTVSDDVAGCSATATFEILEPPKLEILVAVPSDATCFGKKNGRIAVEFAGGTANYVFSWTNTTTGQTWQSTDSTAGLHVIDSLPKGVYQVVLKDLNGCTASVSGLEIGEPAAIGWKNFEEKCQPNGIEYRVYFELEGGCGPKWKVDTNTLVGSSFNGAPIPFGLPYSYIIEDACGCRDTLFGQKNCCLEADSLAVGIVGRACEKKAVQLFAKYGSTAGDWAWTGPNGFVSSEKSPVLAVLDESTAGVYEVKFSLAPNCSVSKTFVLKADAAPILEIFGPKEVCADAPFTLEVEAPFPLENIKWSGPNGFLSTEKMPKITASASGFFSVEADETNGCTGRAELFVEVFLKTTQAVSATICEGEIFEVCGLPFSKKITDSTIVCQSSKGCDSLIVLTLEVKKGETATAFRDSFLIGTDVREFVLEPLENDSLPASGGWTLNITKQPANARAVVENAENVRVSMEKSGFTGWDKFEYEVCPTLCPNSCARAEAHFFVQPNGFSQVLDSIPNSITPNGDGVNDFFDPFESLEERGFLIDRSTAEFVVFEQSGEKIFELRSIPDDWPGWDGANKNGQTLPTGAYFFQLFFKWEGKSRRVKGVINLFKI